MKLYTLLKIGAFHTNYCEDFLVHEYAGSDIKLIAVMDGCTMGEESTFASMLVGKVLRSIAKKHYYTDFMGDGTLSITQQLEAILKELFEQLKSLRNQLGLSTKEMLSTLILGLIDESSKKAEFIVVGDGLIFIDGQAYEYGQEDKPDYLGYHLGESFTKWLGAQKQRFSVNIFNDISICTDGIFTFKDLKHKENQKPEKDIISYFLMDKAHAENDNFLERKARELESVWGHVVTDDIAIIRVIAN